MMKINWAVLFLSFFAAPCFSQGTSLDTTYGAVLSCVQGSTGPLKVAGVYSLDYYEANYKYGLAVRLPAASPNKYPLRFLELIRRFPAGYTHLQTVIEKRWKLFFLEMTLFQGSFVDPDFTQYEHTLGNCTQQQLSQQRIPISGAYRSRYLTDRRIWDAMSETQREIFRFHQVLYGLANQSSLNPSPEKIRHLVVLILSDTAKNMRESEFRQLLKDAGLI